MNESNHFMGPSESPDTSALVADLGKAQLAFRTAGFDATNPHFRSKYATFQACCEAVKEGLCNNGLALPDFRPGMLPNGDWIMVGTLRHKSGQYITGIAPLWFGKKHMQEFGSACTYAKRTLLMALTGASTGEPDDDGESLGTQHHEDRPEPEARPAAKPARRAEPEADAVDEARMLAYEQAAKERIANADDRAVAEKFMAQVKLRAKEKDITPQVFKRIETEFKRVWEGGEA